MAFNQAFHQHSAFAFGIQFAGVEGKNVV